MLCTDPRYSGPSGAPSDTFTKLIRQGVQLKALLFAQASDARLVFGPPAPVSRHPSLFPARPHRLHHSLTALGTAFAGHRLGHHVALWCCEAA